MKKKACRREIHPETYADWVKEGSAWRNIKTGQWSAWHPKAMDIGACVFDAYRKLTKGLI